MIRTRMLCQFALLAIVALAAVPAKAAEQASRPNVVVFLVDDMGLMDTSLPFLTDADGNPKRYPLNDFYRTPGMERLARRGIQFNNFYAMSVCSPTRISIMTGQNAARHHATNWINPRGNNRGPFGPPDWNLERPHQRKHHAAGDYCRRQATARSTSAKATLVRTILSAPNL